MRLIYASILLLTSVLSLTATAADWPQFGGPDGSRWKCSAGISAADPGPVGLAAATAITSFNDVPDPHGSVMATAD